MEGEVFLHQFLKKINTLNFALDTNSSYVFIVMHNFLKRAAFLQNLLLQWNSILASLIFMGEAT